MLGPNPKKAATPSSQLPIKSSGNDNNGDGLMVRAIDEIFNFVKSSENPQNFTVSSNLLMFVQFKFNLIFSLINIRTIFMFFHEAEIWQKFMFCCFIALIANDFGAILDYVIMKLLTVLIKHLTEQKRFSCNVLRASGKQNA